MCAYLCDILLGLLGLLPGPQESPMNVLSANFEDTPELS